MRNSMVVEPFGIVHDVNKCLIILMNNKSALRRYISQISNALYCECGSTLIPNCNTHDGSRTHISNAPSFILTLFLLLSHMSHDMNPCFFYGEDVPQARGHAPRP